MKKKIDLPENKYNDNIVLLNTDKRQHIIWLFPYRLYKFENVLHLWFKLFNSAMVTIVYMGKFKLKFLLLQKKKKNRNGRYFFRRKTKRNEIVSRTQYISDHDTYTAVNTCIL